MTWSEFVHGAISGAGGGVGLLIYQWYQERRRWPYRWKCSQCGFSIKGTDRDSFDLARAEIARDHIENHRRSI